jgi:hypothetical protein
LPEGWDQPGDVFQLEKRYGGMMPSEIMRLRELEDRKEASQPHETWAMDFVHD